MVPEPTMDGLLDLAYTELRRYGADSPQVSRRLLAALRDLAAIALPQHRAAIERHRELLQAAVTRTVPPVPERAFALTPDRQGIS